MAFRYFLSFFAGDGCLGRSCACQVQSSFDLGVWEEGLDIRVSSVGHICFQGISLQNSGVLDQHLAALAALKRLKKMNLHSNTVL